MLVYIPKGLEIDAIIAQYPPKFKAFKSDFLLYIINRILMRSQFKKDTIYFSYVPLMASLLQNLKSNYKDHLNYLIEYKVIECNGKYKRGKHAKGYRLNKRLGYEVKSVKLTDFKLIQNLTKHRKKEENTTKHLKFLTKWYDSKLEIDLDLVNTYCFEKFKTLEGNEHLWDKKRLKGNIYYQKKHPAKQYQHGLLSGIRFSNHDFYLKRDNTSRRFHHNLTNMPSVLRNAVTYNGERLYSIDIKNSQPYLSICLLNKLFWKKNQPYNEQNCPNKKHEAQTHQSPLSYVNSTNIIKYCNNNKLKFNYNMLGEIVEPLLNIDFADYINMVVSGNFYESLKDHFNKSTGDNMSRDEVKEIVFLIIFGGNKGGSSDDIKKKQLFKKLYPNVYMVFSTIKRKEKKVLSCLLQTIESYLILEVITKRISKEIPQAPLLTIHDSIVTTKEYVKRVESIMLEELDSAIGKRPTLSIKEWKPEKLHPHDVIAA